MNYPVNHSEGSLNLPAIHGQAAVPEILDEYLAGQPH